MNSTRPYRAALTPDQVFEELEEGAGVQWDSAIVSAALRYGPRLVAIG